MANSHHSYHCYPWQNNNWKALVKAKQTQTLPHAMLLTGPLDIGKCDFAIAAAAMILCEDGKESACGNCQACHWFTSNTHPDFFYLQAEQKGKAIKVDQVRELITKLSLTAYKTYQVVIIEPAESMNIAAANALLKTLEEPPGKVIFFIVSSAPNLLSATIRSRCQQIKFSLPDKTIVKDWLHSQLSCDHDAERLVERLLTFADYLPLKARELAQNNQLEEQQQLFELLMNVMQGQLDPLMAAEKLKPVEFVTILFALYRLLIDCLKCQLHAKSLGLPIYTNQLQCISQQFNHEQLIELIDSVFELKRITNLKIAVNKQLQLEALFIKMSTR